MPYRTCRIAMLLAASGAALWPMQAAFAQSVSREIVQQLPPAASGALNRALRRLARSPRDLDALIAAGEASLDLNDNEAASGFFSRAIEVAPENPKVLHGLARAQLATGRPIQALDLFARAEAAGVDPATMDADRGLAYDLVGENEQAQQFYKSALARNEDAELRRRLALSHAISGSKQAFERELYAQLEQADRASFRTRAFGLAILGDPDEAVKIAEALMPTDLALRMAPYLRYMPRLTKAQQAAAANLGVFPRAADIGRDDPAIASYAARGAEIAADANAALTPRGEPMGTAQEQPTRTETADPRRRRPDRLAGSAPTEVVGPPAQQGPIPVETTASSNARTERVEDAFSDFTLSESSDAARSAGAVDISSIDPPRELEQVEPEEPAHPARHWAQVATGKDRSALRFDWRRIARRAEGKLDGKGPFVTPWGEANRLLAGPYESAAEAREIVNQLKGLEIDSFPFSSADGQEIEELN